MTPAYDLSGPDGAPVLVLPSSLGTTRELWEPQLDAFAREFRVLRYEHRGHGASPVPPGPYSMEELARDALDLLDELGLERVSWCGLSLGGMVGMWLGANAPERFDALVLACTAARVGAPDAYRARAALVREQGIEPVADAVVGRWFTAETMRERPELPARFRAMVAAQPVEGYAGVLRGARRLGLLRRARRRRRADARARRQRGRGDAGPRHRPSRRADPGRAARHARRRRAPRQPRAPGRVRGRRARPSPGGVMNDDERHEQGMQTRREVLGDAHVDARGRRHDPVHGRLPGSDHPLRLGRDLVAAGARPAHCAARSRSRR